MDKVILEHRFSTHQKITFLLYIGGIFIIGIFKLVKMALNFDLNYKGYIVLGILLLIYSFLISIAFLKRGLLKRNSKLYLGSFFLGKLFFKKKIDISETPKIAVLRFKKTQKLAWFSNAKPDLATDFSTYEINILNDRHTKREPILDLSESENSEKAVDFLTTNFDLEKETYSPNFG